MAKTATKKRARALTVRRSWLEAPLKLRADAQGIAKIASIVRDTRYRLDEAQRVVAERAHVSVHTVSRLERGITKSPHFRTVVDILNSLGWDVTSHAIKDKERRWIA